MQAIEQTGKVDKVIMEEAGSGFALYQDLRATESIRPFYGEAHRWQGRAVQWVSWGSRGRIRPVAQRSPLAPSLQARASRVSRRQVRRPGRELRPVRSIPDEALEMAASGKEREGKDKG